MKKQPHFKKTLLCAVVGTLFAPQFSGASPLSFSTFPPGQSAIPPAPNVVLTVDNSGSMSDSVGGGDPQSKMYRLKEALTNVFNNTALLPDGKIRLAWQAMHNNHGEPANIVAGATNSMKVLDTTHRTNFKTFVNNLTAGGVTPSHQMMFNTYNYMKIGASINSPWASKPGTTENPYLGCRRAYQIFMTDGAWNGQSNAVWPGNTDNTNKIFPDGVPYTIASDQTNVYRGALGNTLADWAMRMWSEDLQPGIPDLIKPSTTDGVPAIETYGAVNLQRYWNPKHNPATWQHLVQYTIGYGTDAYSWPSPPKWSLIDDDNYGAGGDYSKLVQGTVAWVPTVFGNLNANNPAELWHMAINSRGKFYPTGPGRKYSLEDAFKNIIETINLLNTADVTSMAGSASTNIRTDLQKFTAGYNPTKWSGYIKAEKVTTSGTTTPDWLDGGGVQRDSAYYLDNRVYSTRVIITTNDVTNQGVPFEWDPGVTKLSAAQKALLNTSSLGQDRVNFLRGDRSLEGGTISKPFRVRDSVQGDIVNSSIWYVDKPVSNYTDSGYKSFAKTHAKRFGMAYVGGNDGMLHGFKAADGEELIAYVPKAVYPELEKLSNPSYTHQYYVDGSPFTGDVNIANPGTDWRTLLVGTLGAGGKGYFILDVTNPGNSTGTPASNFTTSNAKNLVVMDRTIHPSTPLVTGSDDEDIGHIFAAPVVDDANGFQSTQIGKLNDGRWAVILGNGYNSKNERPVLLIQYLDGPKELKKIIATGNQSLTGNALADEDITANGLSAPKPVDINGDGKVDVVYAGDLKGNLWKFDLTSNTATDWSVSTWNSATATPCNQVSSICKPMFTAKYINGKRQPISAPPIVKPNSRGAGGMMVAFGTGVNVTDTDRTSTDVQTVYSLLDNTRYKQMTNNLIVNTDTSPSENGVIPESILNRTKLVQQTLGAQHSGASFDFWEMSQNSVNYDINLGPTKQGWYFDLPVTSERVLRQMSFFDGSNNLMVYSITPAYGGVAGNTESCDPAGTPEKDYLTLMNIMDGKKPGIQVMDQNGDGLYNSSDNNTSRMTLPPGAISSVTGKKTITLTGKINGVDKDIQLNRMPEQPLRPSWRQVQ